MKKKRIAITVSGRGSNMGALIAACAAPDFPAEIALVFCNVPTAKALETAQAAGIPTVCISHKDFASREAFDAAIDAEFARLGIELVCQAGFMRIHSEGFARKWEGRMLNIHPSLLPAFKGVKVHEQALAGGVKITGCTVHFTVAELDSGPIIAQAAVPVLTGDTPETLAARVLEEEHKLYPAALKLVAEGKVILRDGRAVFG